MPKHPWGPWEPEWRTYWLSFCDATRATGEQFLGVVVVDVHSAEARFALMKHPGMRDKDEGPWIGAATTRAWDAGVNPGGEIAAVRVDDKIHPDEIERLPRLTLLDKPTLRQLGAIP